MLPCKKCYHESTKTKGVILMLNEKIKTLRKQNHLTQEGLAEKLNVSRQAITKWESGAGTPDIGNIERLAKVFSVTVDELLSESSDIHTENISRCEFDIFEKGDFDFSFTSANTVEISTGDFEKVIVELKSDLSDPVYKFAKIKLENGKKNSISDIRVQIDKKYVSAETNKALSMQDAKKHLFIKVMFPKDLTDKIELSGDANTLTISGFSEPKHIEFDGKADVININYVKGHIELNAKHNTEIHYDGSAEQLDVNQLGCISTLYLKNSAQVEVYNKGRSCELIFDSYENTADAESKVELNGRKSELTVRGE